MFFVCYSKIILLLIVYHVKYLQFDWLDNRTSFNYYISNIENMFMGKIASEENKQKILTKSYNCIVNTDHLNVFERKSSLWCDN